MQRHSQKSLTSSHWGAGFVHLRDGRITTVSPHPDDPAPSLINDNIAGSLQGSARVLRPAVRKSYLEQGPLSATGERGRDGYVEVDWDTALDLVATEVQRVRKDHGNEAIYAGSYGWASAGRFHHAQSQLKRFLNTAGGFVRSEGNYSFNAALVLMPHILGNFRELLAQSTRWTSVATHAELVVMFGGVPVRNAQVAGGGVAQHRLGQDLEACAKYGVSFVNFSPLRNDALASLNAEWVAPRPGTDTAVMMGLAHTLLVEGLHDRAFLDRYTVGFDQVAAYLRGEQDNQPKNAEWAARISGIPAKRIRHLAREMASKRTMICTAVSLQRAEFGEQPVWMTVTLAAMLGQIGQPGCGFGIGYGADAHIGTMCRPLNWPSFPQGRNPVETFIPVAMISEMLLNPGGPYDYDGEQMRFPDIRMIWWAGGNPFHHHQDLNRLRRAFQRPETIIVNEINWTATARHADIVLPVTAPQERTDFGAGTQDNALVPMPKAVEPPGEARDEYDIYCALADRLGLGDAFSEGLDSSGWQRRLWSEMRATADAAGHKLPAWKEFLHGDIISFQDPAPDAVLFSEFRKNPADNRLKTPSGRIELFSNKIASFGYEDCPGHPVWRTPRIWTEDERTAHPLHLISGQPTTRLHSQLDNGALSKSHKIEGREPVLINPQDATARGIADGDVVVVQNGQGRCLAGAVVSDDIAAGVVFLWTGAWYDPDLDDPYHTDRHGNPNVLTHDLRASRLSQGPAAQTVLVQISKLEGKAPTVKAYIPPILRSD